jgi:tRNA nucleotidyltransferase (CCA-adding enzyme)
LAVLVCALHLRAHRLGEMKPAAVMRLVEDADLLRRPDRLEDFLAACAADYLGRKGLGDRPYPQAGRLRTALEAARGVQARDLDIEGLGGEQIGARLREARIAAIAAAFAATKTATEAATTGGSEDPAG